MSSEKFVCPLQETGLLGTFPGTDIVDHNTIPLAEMAKTGQKQTYLNLSLSAIAKAVADICGQCQYGPNQKSNRRCNYPDEDILEENRRACENALGGFKKYRK